MADAHMAYELPKRIRDTALKQADAELRAQHEHGIFGDGDPNHPKYNGGIDYTRPLFGQTIAGFLSKQYRKGLHKRCPRRAIAKAEGRG